MEPTAESVVRDLLDSLAAGEVDHAVELLDADVVWRNTYLPTMRGPEVAKRLREMVARGIDFEVRWHHVAEGADGVVLTDRTDVLTYGWWSSEFWCRGTFEVRDGKVAVWDDAFSWFDVIGSGLTGIGRSVLGRLS
ncbi:limonene-1,2-epoxide hydrolase family protein [Nocardioides mangrovi]|uniref:Nuclear transport factor 2 family protein n=1 Tax=Nocardioides mangrovi TaxID=2874580 RepID=A0ABS7UE18_9ACTN|nr:limonene-1,2-epoxide hydrolase family protein [Nocardioides mangrovi]MBZ5739132.1 nuclear transport factor 2 family protein [Nocardioides mangrovi]